MKGLLRKYLFLPLFILLSGLHHVSSDRVNTEVLGSSFQNFFSGGHVEKQRFYAKDFHHKRGDNTECELVEQTSNSFQKDLIDPASFGPFGIKNYANSVFNLLSRRLSLNKPFLRLHLSGTIYLVIRVFRL